MYYKKYGNRANLLRSYTRVDKSDLQVYPYFWLDIYIAIGPQVAKSRDKLVNHSFQLVYNYVAS